MWTRRVVVFPVKCRRRWCVAVPHSDSQPPQSHNQPPQSSLKDILFSRRDNLSAKAELLVDFFSQKMHNKWTALEKASHGSIRHKVYNAGNSLLDRLRPTEILLKSIPKETTNVEVVFPASLNPRLVRRRLRHVALRGAVYHRKFMYISVVLLPFTALLAVLPFPNIPLFWNLFRVHSHWRALQGSERLVLLVSDCPNSWNQLTRSFEKTSNVAEKSELNCPWALCPSKELENLVESETKTGALSNSTILSICRTFGLDSAKVLKWRDYKADL